VAAAIIGGLAAKGIDKQNICVSEPWEVNRNKMNDIGVRTTTSNVEASQDADLLVIAVKPQVTKTVCQELAAAWAERSATPLIISIAAGITLDSLKEWLKLADGRVPHIVRVMPNTPALVGEGASGLYTDDSVSSTEKELAASLLASVSKVTEWVDREDLIDVVTGLSGMLISTTFLVWWLFHILMIYFPGSGPAYFFAMVEHLVDSAIKLGLSREQATRLASQTCLGAGKMLTESTEEPGQLRKNVTSPNGTTAAALESFDASGFKDVVDKAVIASTHRSKELGETLAKS
jgi:pyrroline-5-carboxylate reductase